MRREPRPRKKKKPAPVRARRHPKHGDPPPPTHKPPGSSQAPAPEGEPDPRALASSLSSDPRQTKLLREMLWHNIVREMLTALSLETAQRDDGTPRLLDGRLAVINFRGERIQIAAVRPLLQFGVGKTPQQKMLSMMLEGSVFQIITPDGDVYTLPIHEIRGLHGLSDSILEQLQEKEAPEGQPATPFGFAAFTSLARGVEQPAQDSGGAPMPPAPVDPAE